MNYLLNSANFLVDDLLDPPVLNCDSFLVESAPCADLGSASGAPPQQQQSCLWPQTPQCADTNGGDYGGVHSHAAAPHKMPHYPPDEEMMVTYPIDLCWDDLAKDEIAYLCPTPADYPSAMGDNAEFIMPQPLMPVLPLDYAASASAEDTPKRYYPSPIVGHPLSIHPAESKSHERPDRIWYAVFYSPMQMRVTMTYYNFVA